MQTVEQIRRELPLDAEHGLNTESVEQSRRRFGSNRMTPLPRDPWWKKFLEKFDEPIIKILLAAALLSMVVDLFQHNPTLGGVGLGLLAVAVLVGLVVEAGRWLPTLLFFSAVVLFFFGLTFHVFLVEGLAVMIAVILATFVAFWMEFRSDREFEKLNAQKDAIQIKVIRDGQFGTILLDDVVVGDVIELEMGDEVPADGRLLKATELHIDQSLMTGESEPVHKKAIKDDDAEGFDQPGCVYRGTQVVDGVGRMVVAAVGDQTHLGQIARRLSADEEEEEESTVGPEGEQVRIKRKLTISKALTPLQVKLQNLASLISNVGYVAAIAIFTALVVRGVWVGDLRWPTPEEPFLPTLLKSVDHLLDYFVYMVIVIVVAVPEGLPMSVTVSLALAMQKMTRANSRVRQLVACETIGSATVICSDKTGTLTQNRMRVVRVAWEGRMFDRGGDGWVLPSAEANWPRDGKPIDWLTLNAVVNSTAKLEEKQGKVQTVGNSTEGALLQWVRENNLDYERLREQFEPIYQLHFSSERKRMTTVIRYGDRLVSLVKGAPEMVLERSTHYASADGEPRPWTPEMRQSVMDGIHDSASQAMRTLAFAYAVLPPDTPEDEDSLHERRDALETGLVFIGFVAIRDPLRDDVKDALLQCRKAGIEVKMITGDNVDTARAIAHDIGLIDSHDAEYNTSAAIVMTSDYFNQLTDDELRLRLPKLRVLARARPLDKFRMVKLLQELQEVVAVTGDGTNDAPALKKADVGLSMGIAGTEVAKEASKIVLLDDSFATIVKAVHWGRSLYENIQRFLQFQLTINVSALTIAFLGPFIGIKPPFTVLQLLWINVIMDTFASIALCSEPPRPGVMDLPPKKKDENILTRSMAATIFSTAAFFVVVMIALLLGMKHYDWFAGTGEMSDRFEELTVRQVSIFFTVYVFFQLWNQINCRSLDPRESGLWGVWRNPTFLAIAGTIAVVQAAIINIPWIGRVFEVEPLAAADWGWILLGTASVLVFAEIARRVRLMMRSK